MNDFDKVVSRIQRVLDTRSSYEVAKDLGVSNRTINRYQNGTTPIENMTLETAKKIYGFYERKMTMNKETLETLDQSIKDFNDWSKAAVLYYNRRENYFNVEVFANDVQKSQTFLSEDCFGIFSKSEIGSFKIGEQRRKYAIEFVELVQEGWEPHQAKHQLIMKYPNVY